MIGDSFGCFSGALLGGSGLGAGGKSVASAASEPGRVGRFAISPVPMAVASERTADSSSSSARLTLSAWFVGSSAPRALAKIAVMLDRSGRAGSVGTAGLLASSSAG